MGCASSKSVEASVATDVYRPPPTSIAMFDINTVVEPWLITTTTVDSNAKEENKQEQDEVIKKPMQITLPMLEKLEAANDVAPQLSWSEISKALQDLKPTLDQIPITTSTKEKPSNKETTTTKKDAPLPLPQVAGSLKENCFIVRDRLQHEGNKTDLTKIKWRRPDPLEGYEARCPPGNSDGVVLYTTTLRGVRRTFEDCEWARRIVYPNAVDTGIDVDERDVSLHGEFLKEVRELVGESSGVPRLFVMGRYIGGIDEMVEINERGKLKDMMRLVARKGGKEVKGGWADCKGCGGARFVPCLECNGSCKVLKEDVKEVVRCDKCNENGLVMCPMCH